MRSNLAPTASAIQIAELKADLLAAIPKLRAYAKSLCRSMERADDLVQEALAKALANIGSFEPGSNMTAWLYAILRNGFFSEYRKRRHEVEDSDGDFAALARVHPVQEVHVELLNVQDAVACLTAEHREALMLIVSGLSYDEAAALCSCASGTMKSRVSRARAKLVLLLEEPRSEDGVYALVPAVASRFSQPSGVLPARESHGLSYGNP